MSGFSAFGFGPIAAAEIRELYRETRVWYGATGIPYTHRLYRLDEPLPTSGGHYLMVARGFGGGVHALYGGECQDFSARLRGSHEKYWLAVVRGMTEFHLYSMSGGVADRELVETDLRRALRPPLNMQGAGIVGALNQGLGTVPPNPYEAKGLMAAALLARIKPG